MKPTKYMVTIVQANAHIERRVWVNAGGKEFVRINGHLYTLDWCYEHYDKVFRWFD